MTTIEVVLSVAFWAAVIWFAWRQRGRAVTPEQERHLKVVGGLPGRLYFGTLGWALNRYGFRAPLIALLLVLAVVLAIFAVNVAKYHP